MLKLAAINLRLSDVDDVVKRIEKKIPFPRKKEEMIEKVTEYNRTKDPRDDISLEESHMLYPHDDLGDEFDVEGVKRDLDVNWSSHAQYRSDLRDIDPDKVNTAIRDSIDIRPHFNKHEKVRMDKSFGTAVVDFDGRRPSDVEADVITVFGK